MKVDVLDLQGNKIEDIELNKDVFGVEPNQSLLAQYIRIYLHNQRQGTAATKTRGMVSGGGKKPWKQKHTGRARVGSSRNPIWRHGGVAHGPQPKDWSLKLTQSMRKAVMVAALSLKAKDNQVAVLDKLADIKEYKTKVIATLMTKLGVAKHTLFVTAEKNDYFVKSARNLPKVSLGSLDNLNAYTLLKSDKVIFSKKALQDLEAKYASK